LGLIAYKNAPRVRAMMMPACATCLGREPILFGILVWFVLVALMLCGVRQRARKSVKAYADDEENVVSLHVEPQFITPWMCDAAYGERLRSSFPKRKPHAP
jgi:hypothetical protein